MNQGAARFLIAVVLGAAVLGMIVLLSVPDYRQGKIVDTNHSYIPGVRVDNSDLPLAVALPTPEDLLEATPGETPAPDGSSP